MGELVSWYEKLAAVTVAVLVGWWVAVGWLLAETTPSDSIRGLEAVGWITAGFGVGVACLLVWLLVERARWGTA